MKKDHKTAVKKIRGMALDKGYEFLQLGEYVWKLGSTKNGSHIELEYFPDLDNLTKGTMFIDDVVSGKMDRRGIKDLLVDEGYEVLTSGSSDYSRRKAEEYSRLEDELYKAELAQSISVVF